MKKPALSLIVLLLGVGFSAGSSQHSPAKDRVHMDWLLERIDEVKSIEEGMSLEDLLKVFRREAGLQPVEVSGSPLLFQILPWFFFFLITHKCQPQLTGDRATEESAQRHERVEEPNQRVGSGG